MSAQRLLPFVFAFLVAASISAATDPTYIAVREARPDGRSVALTNFAFDRDVYHFTLNGTLHLLPPANGSAFGAVFIGQGTYTLTPAIEDERRELGLSAGDTKLTALSDTFDSAVFFDTALLKDLKPSPGTPSAEALKTYDDFLKRERKDFTTNLHIRVLQDLLDPLQQPVFLAFIRGKKVPPAILAIDPRGADALRLFDIGDEGEGSMLLVQDSTKGGIWYLAHLKSDYASGNAAVMPHVALADRYTIDTAIAPNNEISATTVMAFTCRLPGRVLPISLARKLRIDSAEISPATEPAAWAAVPFIQENENEDADAAVVLPERLMVGTKYLLRTKYHGRDVLRDAGDGNFTVGSRDSWYTNVGSFREPADFRLTFRLPLKSKNQIVAVGTELENKVEGDQRVAVWQSTHPVRVAGFNFGNFK